MPAIKRLRLPVTMMSGLMFAAVAFAGSANAAKPYPPPAPPPQVLGVSQTVTPQTLTPPAAAAPRVLGVSQTAPALAFTGTNAVGIGALGGLLLLGGGLMLVTGKRRKVDS